MSREQRRYPRADADWLVMIDTPQGFLSARTIDISAGGAFICSQKSIEKFAEVHMSFFDIPLLNRPLPVKAEVIRSNIHCTYDELRPHGAGVRFTEISAEDRKLISTLVSDHLENE
jgi:c-di-GMP-binding flagellar brake protein YcgR